MLKRRTTTVAPLPSPLVDVLLHGELRPKADRGPDYNPLLRYITPVEELKRLWQTHREALLAEWITDHPGTRPVGWWRFDAQEERKRLGGIGEPYGHGTFHGIPVCWVTPSLGRHLTPMTAIDPDDPPRFESEAAYLERLGLLTAAERRRLTDDAFEPETVTDEDDDE